MNRIIFNLNCIVFLFGLYSLSNSDMKICETWFVQKQRLVSMRIYQQFHQSSGLKQGTSRLVWRLRLWELGLRIESLTILCTNFDLPKTIKQFFINKKRKRRKFINTNFPTFKLINVNNT